MTQLVRNAYRFAVGFLSSFRRMVFIFPTLAAGLALAPLPAQPYGVPLCFPAEQVLDRKEAAGWQVEFFAMTDNGAAAYIAVGPSGEVEVFSISQGGLACLIFGGLRTEPPVSAAPPVEMREG